MAAAPTSNDQDDSDANPGRTGPTSRTDEAVHLLSSDRRKQSLRIRARARVWGSLTML